VIQAEWVGWFYPLLIIRRRFLLESAEALEIASARQCYSTYHIGTMKKARILIAEDNDLNRENLIELLSGNGYEVKAVRDGREAMDVFPCDNYDLIITQEGVFFADINVKFSHREEGIKDTII